MGRKFRSYYWLWLLIPTVYLLLYKWGDPVKERGSWNSFYTSVHASHNVQVSLYVGKKNTGTLSSGANKFTLLNYVNHDTLKDSVELLVSGALLHDTITFLPFNISTDRHIFALSGNSSLFITPSKNVYIDKASSNLSVIVTDTNNHEIRIALKHPKEWRSDSILLFSASIFILIFVLCFILLLYKQPGEKYFLTSTLVSIIAMCFYFWVGKDVDTNVKFYNDRPMNTVAFYYNNVPSFVPLYTQIGNKIGKFMRAQTYLAVNPYFRISFPGDTMGIQNLQVVLNTGIISKKWKLNSLPLGETMLNDINYNNKTSSYYIAGPDPYISFITAPCVREVNKVLFLRYSVFLLFTLITFFLLLYLEPIFTNVKAPELILLVMCTIIITSGISSVVFNSHRMVLDAEKRLANIPPNFGSGSLADQAKKTELYLDDQLSGRNEMIVSNNFVKYELFHRIPGNPIVYFGKDGWMFYTGDNTREIYENQHPLTDDELKRMKIVFESRRDWLKKKGIRYYIVFPRMSNFFYQEEIGPEFHVYNAKPKLEQLIEYLKKESTLDIIDVYTPMLEAKRKYGKDLYYRSDSHWNLLGSYFAYKAIIDYIRKDFPNMPPPIPYDSIRWEEKDSHEGDLATLTALSKVITRHEYLPLNSRVNDFKSVPAPDYKQYVGLQTMVFNESGDSAAPRLIMNRDSYTNFLIPYFATNFSRQGYLWSPLFFPEVIQKEKPDIVITEMMERFIYDILAYNPPIPVADSVNIHATDTIHK